MNRQTEIELAEIGVFNAEQILAAAKKSLSGLKAEPKFYKGQQVLARDNDNENYVETELISMSRCMEAVFITSEGHFKKCISDPNAITLPNWIAHDGNAGSPVDGGEFVVFDYAQYTNKAGTKRGGGLAIDVNWSIVTRYFVVPEYEEL